MTPSVMVTPSHLTFWENSHILNVFKDLHRGCTEALSKTLLVLLLARKYAIHIKEAYVIAQL